MKYKDEIFGVMPDGEKVHRLVLSNERGTEVAFLNFGLIIQAIQINDKDGKKQDVVLGYDKLDQYLDNYPMFGATCGRVINRISNAEFALCGKTYHLVRNRGRHNIHSDKLHGFHKVIWDYQVIDNSSIRFHYFSPDGECGFPSNLDMYITYSLTENDTLIASYRGDPDQMTVLNPSNHTYFNLNGQKDNTINDISFRICAHCFTPTDNDTIPTGEIKPVDGSDMDLQNFRTFADMIHSQDPQIVDHHGFDHNYAIDGCNFGVRQAASAYSSKTGIEISIYSDLPGLQFYTGQSLHNEFGKGGIEYGPYAGFCMEPQYFPNAINTDSFVKPIFSPSNPYKSTMIYIFNIR